MSDTLDECMDLDDAEWRLLRLREWVEQQDRDDRDEWLSEIDAEIRAIWDERGRRTRTR